jgi:prefoldin subunit 5
MAEDAKARAQAIRDFEDQAEELVAYQLDLLAHLEQQLRAAHHLMRNIEKLRNVKRRRGGPELSNGERGDTLSHLDAELDALDTQVRTQRQLCSDMHQTINQMQTKLEQFRQGTRRSPSPSEEASDFNPVERVPGHHKVR